MIGKKQKLVERMGPEYICPYCFSRVDLSRVHYQCTGQSCARQFAAQVSGTRNEKLSKYVSSDGMHEIDVEKTNFLRSGTDRSEGIVADLHIIRDGSGVCDICNRPVYTRLCPHCHNFIPAGAEEESNRIFVILGPKGVGKSHYIAVLINQLRNYVSSEFNGTFSPATDHTTIKYRNRYYNRLFQERRTLPPTKSLQDSEEAREPLIYYLRIFDEDHPKVYTFAFFDTAGEDLVSQNKIQMNNLNSFIAKAAGLVYLVDPLQISYINRRIHVDNKPGVGPDVSDILNNIAQIIRTYKRISARDRIDTPLAVCLTKSDVLLKHPEDEEEAKVLLPLGSSLYIPREHQIYDEENFMQIDAELEEYIRRTVGEDFIQTVNGFNEHCFFAVSALGCNPVANVIPSGVLPKRVEDPFIWLLNREGLR